MATETDIFAALMARVGSLVLSPVLPASAIAWPNVTFTPPASQRYLEPKYVPNAADRFGVSTTHQIYGLLQLNIHGKKNTGEPGVRADAAAIVAYFPADLELASGATKVRITARPEARDMIVADASVFVPVMVAWETFA